MPEEPEGNGRVGDDPVARFAADPLLRGLAESPLQALLLISLEPFRLEYCNPAAAEMLGIRVDDCRARSLDELFALVHPDDRAKQSAVFAGRQRGEAVSDRFRVRLRRPDAGEGVRWLDGVVRSLDIPGRRLAYVAFVDVTAGLEAVAAFEAGEARYRLLFEEMNDAAFLADAETGYLLDANKGAERLMARPRHELIGMHQQYLHPPGEAERYREKFRDHIRHGHARDFDGEIQRPDGTRVPVAISAAIFEQGGRRYNLGMFRDLTEVRRQEEGRLRLQERMLHVQKHESLGLLAGGVAHDFNNLLQAMLGNADLLFLDLPPDSRSLELVEQIRTAAREAAGLVRQLLNYAGRGQATLSDVDLNELARAMADLLRVSLPRNVKLEFALQDDLAPVRADPTQVRQILMNLIVNAAEATGEAGGVVRLSTGEHTCNDSIFGDSTLWVERPKNESCVFLEVRDEGCGMDAETRGRVFDPFFSTKTPGRGLGLAVVLGIVRAHDAGLEVQSAPGAGTTVRIHFARASGVSRKTPLPRSTPPDGFRRQGVVMVVDDKDAPRAVVRAMLERVGFTVVEAADGARAIEEFRRRAGDLRAVVLDLVMPGLAGDQVLEELRRIRPEVPVILISGYDEPSLRDGLRPDAFVHKPFVLEDLVRVLRRTLPES